MDEVPALTRAANVALQDSDFFGQDRNRCLNESKSFLSSAPCFCRYKVPPLAIATRRPTFVGSSHRPLWDHGSLQICSSSRLRATRLALLDGRLDVLCKAALIAVLIAAQMRLRNRCEINGLVLTPRSGVPR
jgi:hypothetical protein